MAYSVMMPRSFLLSLSAIAWFGVWTFWLALTYSFHPTFILAVIVTTSLTTAYAIASYVNHLILLPRVLNSGRYWSWLSAMMALLTGIALIIIRVSYFQLLGPDADPWGAPKHYAIDFFGMVVHVAVAALVVRVVKGLKI